jgi:ribosome-associated protein
MDQEERKSKSQVKREMHALEKLGEMLTKLPAQQIQNMDLPEELKGAILFAQSISKHGARKRQRKYIGALMRNVDPEPILIALRKIEGEHEEETQNFQELEHLRDDLIGNDTVVLEDVLNRFPRAERQRLNQLVRNARREKELGKPPKAYRLLFGYLKELSQDDPA